MELDCMRININECIYENIRLVLKVKDGQIYNIGKFTASKYNQSLNHYNDFVKAITINEKKEVFLIIYQNINFK